MLDIYIPTHGRADGPQTAYTQLEAAGLRPTLVADASEPQQGYRGRRTLFAPVRGIAPKRQWIADRSHGRKFMMIDDDIQLASVTHKDDKCVIDKEPSGSLLQVHISAIEVLLEEYAHGGVHTRHFVNYQKQPYIENRGYYRQIMAFNPRLFPQNPPPRFRGTTAEDVRYMLDLLDQGKDYFIYTALCMIEVVPRGQKKTWSHWDQQLKNEDMTRLTAQYMNHRFITADGRYALRYANILKDAKKRLKIK